MRVLIGSAPAGARYFLHQMAPRTKAGRRILVVAALATAVAALLTAIATAAGERGVPRGESSACSQADQPAAEATLKELRRSVRCLINEERAIRGQDAVTRQGDLQQVAQHHSKRMAATDCLAHRCEGEAKLENRIRRAGYFRGAERWEYAESTGCGLSAEAMVTSWLQSDYHRVNLLERSFEDIGVGVVQKRVKDRCGKGYGTFAALFGVREPAG